MILHICDILLFLFRTNQCLYGRFYFVLSIRNCKLSFMKFQTKFRPGASRVCKQTLAIPRNFQTFLPIDTCKSSTKYERGGKQKTKARTGNSTAARQTIENVLRECSSTFLRGRELYQYSSRFRYEITFRRIYKSVIQNSVLSYSIPTLIIFRKMYIFIRFLANWIWKNIVSLEIFRRVSQSVA